MSQPTGTGQQSGQTDPSQQSGTGEPQGTSGTGTQSDPAGQQSGTQDPQTGQGNQDFQAQLDQLKQKLSLSDKRAQDAETKLRDAERAKMDELTRTKAELEEAKQKLAQAEEHAKQQQIQLAFLQDNTYKWRDPAVALKVADMSGVQFKEDGTVQGLKEALKTLAEKNPWMLDTGDGQQQQGQGGTGQPAPARRTVPGNDTGRGNASDRNAMETKFPALRGRVQAS